MMHSTHICGKQLALSKSAQIFRSIVNNMYFIARKQNSLVERQCTYIWCTHQLKDGNVHNTHIFTEIFLKSS